MHKTPALALVFVVACAGTTPPPSDPNGPGVGPMAPGRGGTPMGSANGLPARPPLDAGRVACTEIGCSSGLSVALEPGMKWPADDYRIEIEADGAVQACTVTLPLRDCSAGPSVACTGASLATIGESGCALPAPEHGLSSIQLSGSPTKGKITVSRGGTTLVAQDLAPAYRWVQPNGTGCEPKCLQASTTLRVPL